MADKERFRQHYDVVVIGTGLGGLTAAALLATQGKCVVAIEQHYLAGGNATVFRRKGFTFDVGVHYIGDAGPNGLLPRVFRAVGAKPVYFRPLDPDAIDRFVFPDFEFVFPQGIERYRLRLLEHFPREQRCIQRLLRLLEAVQALMRAQSHPWRVVPKLLRSVDLARVLNRPWSEFLAGCTSDQRLRAVLSGHQGIYALPPSRVSTLVHAVVLLHYLGGAYYPEGGGQVLADRLVQAIEEHGGQVWLRTKVQRILIEGGKAVGVEIEGKGGHRRVRADVVVSNADLKRTVLDLVGPEYWKPSTVERVRGFEMAPALGIVYLGMKSPGGQVKLPDGNVWIYPSYSTESVYRAIGAGRFPPRPPLFITFASTKDPLNPHVAPEGHINLQLMAPVPSNPAAWGASAQTLASGEYSKLETYERAKERFAEQVKAVARESFAFVGRPAVVQEVATPLTHTRYTLSSGGTGYGIAATPSQSLLGRPGWRTEIPGLFLCGASTRSGHGIAGVVMSGLSVAREIAGPEVFKRVMGRANRV